MSTPVTDQLRAYFDDVDRQQGAVDLDALRRSAEEGVTMIEVSPDAAVVRPDPSTGGRRWPILIAAAAVLLVGVLVVFAVDEATPADQPSPTVTAAPDLFGGLHELVPGTYFVDEIDGIRTPRIFLTFGAGWWSPSDTGAGSYLGTVCGFDQVCNGGSIWFGRPDAVYSDVCHWGNGYRPGPVATVDDLVAVLTEQGGWAEVTAPSDISIDGYTGTAFQRTAPADLSDCSTIDYSPRHQDGDRDQAPHALRSWDNKADNLAGTFYEPGMIETVWVLDLDGTVVVINTRAWPESSAAGHAQLADVLDSIRIDRP